MQSHIYREDRKDDIKLDEELYGFQLGKKADAKNPYLKMIPLNKFLNIYLSFENLGRNRSSLGLYMGLLRSNCAITDLITFMIINWKILNYIARN